MIQMGFRGFGSIVHDTSDISVRLSKLDAGEISHQDWSVEITCLRYPLTVSML